MQILWVWFQGNMIFGITTLCQKLTLYKDKCTFYIINKTNCSYSCYTETYLLHVIVLRILHFVFWKWRNTQKNQMYPKKNNNFQIQVSRCILFTYLSMKWNISTWCDSLFTTRIIRKSKIVADSFFTDFLKLWHFLV